MAAEFLSRGRVLVKKAVACDKTHDYKKAYNYYTIAADYFEMAIKYEKSKPRSRAIQQKLDEYRLRICLIEKVVFDPTGLGTRITDLEREVTALQQLLDERLGSGDGNGDAKSRD